LAKRTEVKVKPVIVRCPVCNKGFNYYRSRTHDYQCRACGAVFKWDAKSQKGKLIDDKRTSKTKKGGKS